MNEPPPICFTRGDSELKEVVDILGNLVETPGQTNQSNSPVKSASAWCLRKGEGAKLYFYKPEWEKGCDMTGGTFKAKVELTFFAFALLEKLQ